jgi:tripartite-type tricarboxylate transporter receptor subunit TctC
VRALGTSGLKRSTVMPEVPTIAEAGVKGYETTIWLGIMAPAGTPKPVIDRLNAEITKVVNRADVRKIWGEQGAQPLPNSRGTCTPISPSGRRWSRSPARAPTSNWSL